MFIKNILFFKFKLGCFYFIIGPWHVSHSFFFSYFVSSIWSFNIGSRRKSNCDNAISQSDDSHGNEDEELAVIVEGVTHSMPPDILLASGIVLQVENKASDEFPSSRGNDALSSSSETDHEVNFSCEFQFLWQYSSSLMFNTIVLFQDADSILSSRDDSMSEAAIAEIEAGIYGLQVQSFSVYCNTYTFLYRFNSHI